MVVCYLGQHVSHTLKALPSDMGWGWWGSNSVKGRDLASWQFYEQALVKLEATVTTN